MLETPIVGLRIAHTLKPTMADLEQGEKEMGISDKDLESMKDIDENTTFQANIKGMLKLNLQAIEEL